MVAAGAGESAPWHAAVESLWPEHTEHFPPASHHPNWLANKGSKSNRWHLLLLSLTFGQSLRGEEEQGETKTSLCLCELFQKSDQAATGNTGHQLEAVDCSDSHKVRSRGYGMGGFSGDVGL